MDIRNYEFKRDVAKQDRADGASMAATAYIPIRRRFSPVGTNASTWLSRRMLGDRIGEPWDAIVPVAAPATERSAVVVLGPSGVGKTEELSERACQLRDAGVTAFFVSAVDVAAAGVIGAMPDPAAFRRWADMAFPPEVGHLWLCHLLEFGHT